MEHTPRCLGSQKEEFHLILRRKPLWNKHASDTCFSCFMISALLLAIILVPLNLYGSWPPITDLTTFILHNNTMESGNFTVVFQAKNPSWVLGFQHKYLHTIVSARHQGTLLWHTQVPEFTLAHKSSRDVCADGVLGVNKTMGFGRQFVVAVDAQVKVKSLGWHQPKWFNFTCWVDAGRAASYGCNEACGRHDVCGVHYLFSKNCSLSG